MPEKRPHTPWSRLTTGIVGGILIGLTILWLLWLALHTFTATALSIFPFVALRPTPAPISQPAPLTALGITLRQSDQKPALNQQQALLLASQWEPVASVEAKSTHAQYLLLTYTPTNTSAAHTDFNNIPVWMILYQNIPLTPDEPSVNTTTSYTLYVFLDAKNGKELLAVRL